VTCQRCGLELRDDPERGVVDERNGRPDCPKGGGPHRPAPAFTDDQLERAMRDWA
jgi:hypothetical protein